MSKDDRYPKGTVILLYDKNANPNGQRPGKWRRLPEWRQLVIEESAEKGVGLPIAPHYHKIKLGFLQNNDMVGGRTNAKQGAFNYETNSFEVMQRTGDTGENIETGRNSYKTVGSDNGRTTEGTTDDGDGVSMQVERTTVHAWVRYE